MTTKCYICFENKEGDAPFLRLKCCDQTIHKECLLEWIVKRPSGTAASCPFCRNKVENIAEYVTYHEIFTFLKRRNFRVSGLRQNERTAEHSIEIVTSNRTVRNATHVAQRLDNSYKTRCILMTILVGIIAIFITIWQVCVYYSRF